MTNIERNANGRSASTLQRFNRLRLPKPPRAFTLIELILVLGIITVLTGLVLSTVGYARKKAALTRAETEIAAMSAAIENYKADNAVYPRDNATNGYTDALDAKQNLDPTRSVYKNASLYLFTQLSGLDQNQTPITGAKTYFTFKPSMLDTSPGTTTVIDIRDPFGNSYGYSTANQADPNKGYNPTFDLWSTAGVAASPTPAPPATQQDLWIKNW
jgi:prepilin-type N-terminal cleavage/methylation domain-containing protein